MMPFSECHDANPPASPLVYRAALAAATVIFMGAAQAEMSLNPACVFDEGSQSSCTHVVACIGGDTLFVGGTIGWDAGILAGELSTGAICEGSWNNATGQAMFSCDDGQSGQVNYTLFDGLTGTAIGTGTTLAGRSIEAWSGHNIAGYIEAETGRVTLSCGVRELLLG